MFGRVRCRPKTAALTFVLFLLVVMNVLAFVHAWTMTHFVAGGAKTPGPDELSAASKVGVLLTGVRLAKPVNTITPATLNLPYETVRYRGGDGTDYEAWHVPAGGSPWRRTRGGCLLFHGYAGCKAGVLGEAGVARRAGYDAFLADFRGSGGSSGLVTTIGYVEANDVADAWDYVQKNLRPPRVVVYGQSMGAAAVMRAVSLGKVRPDALVLESPFDRMLTTVANRFKVMGLPPFPFARTLVFWGGVQQRYWAFGHNPVEYAGAINCPTLLIRGGRDPFIRTSESDSVYDRISAPKRLLVFEGAGHEACVAVDRGKWERAVGDFLRAAPRGVGR